MTRHTKLTMDPRCEGMGERLFQTRRERNLNKDELARRANVTAPTLHNLENGTTIQPNVQCVLSVCAVLNIRPQWLVFNEGEKYPPGPVETPKPVEIERVPVELGRCLIKLVEEMQNARLYSRENLVEAVHLDRWLGTLLKQPQLATLRDHLLRMPQESEASPVERPVLPLVEGQHMPVPSASVSVLSDRRMSIEGDPIDQHAKVARLVPPATARAVAEIEAEADADATASSDGANVVRFSLDPMKGDKVGSIKKGSHTHNLITKGKHARRRDGRLRVLDVCSALGISSPTFYQWKATDPDFPPTIVADDGQPCFERVAVEKYLALKVMQRKQGHGRKVL